MKKNFLFSLACVLWLSVSVASSEAALAAGGLKFAPLNPEYVKYLDGNSKAKTAPSPIDWSYLKKPKKLKTGRTLDLPSRPVSFDLSAMGMTPPVANQRNWGTCWAFASIAAMESNLLRRGEDVRLSEFHLAYWTYSYDDVNKLPGFTRTTPWEQSAEDPMNPIFDNGASPEQPVAILSRGTGPVLAADVPYPEEVDDMGGDDWENFLPPAPYAEPRYRLKEASFYKDPSDIKGALVTTGGLDIVFHAGDAIGGQNYYSEGEELPDHAVLLVGWDDDYPAEAFRSGDVIPPGPGAWKIQNSWGTEQNGAPVGDNGYFYISYHDTSFLNGASALSLELEPVESDGIYLHDPLGFCLVVEGNGFTEWHVANVFEAERDEDIVSVGFMTANEDMVYEVEVYKDIPARKGPNAGKLSYALRSTTETIGYHTVRFDEPVRVKKGERFAVAVKMETTDGSEAFLPVETMLPQYSDNAAVAPGESYVLVDLDGEGEEWLDAYDLKIDDVWDFDTYSARNFNVCIKAFTVASGKSGNGSGCNAGAGTVLSLLAAALLTLLSSVKKK